MLPEHPNSTRAQLSHLHCLFTVCHLARGGRGANGCCECREGPLGGWEEKFTFPYVPAVDFALFMYFLLWLIFFLVVAFALSLLLGLLLPSFGLMGSFIIFIDSWLKAHVVVHLFSIFYEPSTAPSRPHASLSGSVETLSSVTFNNLPVNW